VQKRFALTNEIKPALPAWYVPTANGISQKDKKKAVINFVTDCFWGVQMLIDQKPVYTGNKALSRRIRCERSRFLFFFFF